MGLYEPFYETSLNINRLSKFLLVINVQELNWTLQETIVCWYQSKIGEV